MHTDVSDVPHLDGYDLAAVRAARGDAGPMSRVRFTDGDIGWLVTGYQIAREVLSNPRFSVATKRSEPVADPFMHAPPADESEPWSGEATSPTSQTAFDRGEILSTDPPEHTFFRRLVAGHLSASRVRDHLPLVRRLAHETLDEMTSVAPPVDLKSAFSVPFSIRTICAVLGLDYELKEVLHDFITAIEQSPPDAAAIPRALHVREEAVRTAIRAKKAEPTDDVISAFVASPDVTEDQLVGIVVFLSEAGHFTTSNLLTHGVYTLLDDREHWAAIGSDEAAAARTVEELLRHLSTVQAGASVRVATADVVIDGIMIREGEQVYVSLPAANHDPAAFPDPHRFDTGREGAHLGFSFGIHQCLGQHLARLELTVALHILAKRFPDLTIAVPREEVRPLRRTFPLNGLLELPVSWE